MLDPESRRPGRGPGGGRGGNRGPVAALQRQQRREARGGAAPDVAKSAYLLFCERVPRAAADAPPPAVVEIDAEPGPIGGSAGGAAVGHGEDTKGRPADNAEMQDGEEHDVEMLDT